MTEMASSPVHVAGYPPGGSYPPGYGPPGGQGGPAGGGFGGPPGGGFGSPPGGGFGQGPVFAAPPPPSPKKSGPNVGVLLGIGCAALLVIVGAIVGVLMFVSRRASSTYSSPATTSRATPASTPASGGTTSADAKAEVRDLRDFKGEFGKVRHFVGEIHNTGTDPIGFLTAKVTVFDAGKTALDSGTCASLVRVIEPGEKVPCTLAMFKADSWASFKVEVNPHKAFSRDEIAKLAISGTKFTAKRGFQPNQVEGKITNTGDFKAKSVWAIVSLYGSDGKIVGADQAPIAGNDLEAGASGLFSAKVFNVAAAPETFQVRAVGYRN